MGESRSTTPSSSPSPSPSSSDISESPPTSLSSSDDTKGEYEIQLPSPFYPPTLAEAEEGSTNEYLLPRELPEHLNFPAVPQPAPIRSIDAQDIGTPDAWIPRDTRLVRLTGKHPFNCEAKLEDLFAQGFLTPTSLFYVRNHGAVPRIDQEKGNAWQLEIHGLCQKPITLSMEDLRTKFRVVTNPITFVCAGNRRKEQNVIQKSLGFSWGAAGLSTTLFTGVYLSDVLDYVQPTRGAKHVVFEGCDDLPNGHYGTSQRLGWARDPRKRMMLAWAMNGVALEPDHGYPLRLVVPGQIGGRSVKWLKRIEISDVESQHYLHFHDNKVLPTTFGPDEARQDKQVWKDPKYIINDLNANSAIACPNHDEQLDVSTKPGTNTYHVQGYAYAGGGRRVARVEISFDDGESWNLCNIAYPEDLFRAAALTDPIYGNLDITDSDECFCWCFWNYDVSLDTLKNSDAMMVRCMDESLALQPRDMYWNPTGMMNNWWFRIVIHKEAKGILRFEHPTMAGNQPGGWMQRLKDKGLDPLKANFSTAPESLATGRKETKKAAPEVSMKKAGVHRMITSEELVAHNKEEEPWFVVKNEVYDGTGYLKDHPGGSQSITLVAGEDATEDFMAIHSADARLKLAQFHIGTLSVTASSGQAKQSQEQEVAGPFLNQKKWKKVKLVQIDQLSPDTKLFKFALDRPDQELGLPIGQHVYIRLRRKPKKGSNEEGPLVQRAYTPMSKQGDLGFIEMLIKIYYPNAAYPEGGLMTVGFAELEIGDTVELKGPIGHFIWKGKGIATIHGHDRRVREVGLICGGSGITPILQVLRGILHDEGYRTTKVHVLDVNRYFDDILCRAELHALLAAHNARYRLHHTLTGKPAPADWRYSTGRINLEMLKINLPQPADDCLICICGPPAMEQITMKMLVRLGWNPENQIIKF